MLLLLLLASYPTKHFSCHTSIKKEIPHRQEGQRHSQVLMLASFEHQPGRIPAYPQHKRKYNTDRKHKDTVKCCCWHHFPAKYISCHTSTYKEIHHRQEAQRHSQVLLLLLLASFPTKHFSCHTSIKKELPHRQEGQRHSQVLLLASFEHQPGRIPAYPQHKRKYNTDRKHKDTGKCC